MFLFLHMIYLFSFYTYCRMGLAVSIINIITVTLFEYLIKHILLINIWRFLQTKFFIKHKNILKCFLFYLITNMKPQSCVKHSRLRVKVKAQITFFVETIPITPALNWKIFFKRLLHTESTKTKKRSRFFKIEPPAKIFTGPRLAETHAGRRQRRRLTAWNNQSAAYFGRMSISNQW